MSDETEAYRQGKEDWIFNNKTNPYPEGTKENQDWEEAQIDSDAEGLYDD